MLDAQLIHLRRNGKENVTHKCAIEEGHLKQLKTSGVFSLSYPLSLLSLLIWFHTVLFFCQRGREGQRALTTKSFKFATDAAGRKFVTMAHDEASKNHPGDVHDSSSNKKEATMYESGESNHGYKALKLYLEKINLKCNAFFQYPKSNLRPEDNVWFEYRPLGVNNLANMINKISEVAGLSTTYTNHSIRATAITLWSSAGVPNWHIMSISGHQNEQSLAHYNSRPSISQLQNCSDVLSRALAVTEASYTRSSSSVQFTVRVNCPSQKERNSAPSNIAREVAPFFKDCSIQNEQFVFNSSENHSKFN